MSKVCNEYLKGEHELFEFKIPVTIPRHDFEVIHVKGKKKTISLLYLTMQAIVSAPRCMCIFSIPKVAMWGFKLTHYMFLNVGSWVHVA
jgi:hypothetical protein